MHPSQTHLIFPATHRPSVQVVEPYFPLVGPHGYQPPAWKELATGEEAVLVVEPECSHWTESGVGQPIVHSVAQSKSCLPPNKTSCEVARR